MKQARVITKEEFKRVLAVIATYKHSERNTAIFYLSFGAGLRACEIAGLNLEDVVDEQGKVKTQILLKKEQTKGNTANSVMISKALQQRLQKYVEKTKFRKCSTAFIQSQKGKSFTGLTITQLFKKFYDKAGVYLASGHTGRRKFATDLSLQGVNVKIIQQLMRHKHVSTTLRYVEVTSKQLENAVELVTI